VITDVAKEVMCCYFI